MQLATRPRPRPCHSQGGGSGCASVRFLRFLWVGVVLVILAGASAGVVGVSGGVASAQTQEPYFYTQSRDPSQPFVRVTDDERTNVGADGLTRTYTDAAGDEQLLYRIPYIEVTVIFQSRSGLRINYQEAGRHTMARGFTSVRHSISEGTGAGVRYLPWDCSGPLVTDTSGPSLSGISDDNSTPSFTSAFLPYARELTLVEDDDATTDPEAIPELVNGKLCVAPDALDANPFYLPAAGIGNANQGRGASAHNVAAYMAPTGWVIESHEIIYPEDGAAIEDYKQVYRHVIGSSPARAFPVGFDYLTIDSAPTEGVVGGPFISTITYHDDGVNTGNGIGRISIACSGGYNPNITGDVTITNVDGLRRDNSWCTRGHVPVYEASTDLLLPSFDADVSGSAVAVTCAFQVDGICRDVTTSSVDYIGDTILTGSTHDFVMKVHSTKPLALLQLGIGASGPGAPVGTADVVVEMRVVEDYTTATGYRLANLTYSNNGAQEVMRNNEAFRITPFVDAVNTPTGNVTLTSEPCSANQPEQCLVATISNLTFTAPFARPVYSLTAINTEAQQTTRYAR